MTMKEPSHPGAVVRTCVDGAEMTVTDAAKLLGISRQALNNLVNEKSALTPEMAIRLEKVGWSNAGHWLRMQMAFDLAQARASEHNIIVQRVANQ